MMADYGQVDDWSWAVGLFEGEGSISMMDHRYVQLCLNTTDEDVAKKFHALVGGRLYGPYRNPAYKEHWKSQWLWRMNGHPARELLLRLRPYLGTRRAARADEVLSLIEAVA